MFLVFPDTASIAQYVSTLLVDTIKSKPEAVLGLATGATMEPVYACFIQQARQHALDVSRLRSFNLDEYVGLAPDHPQSYAAFMSHHLFDHLSFDPSRLAVPDGRAADVDAHCREYSERIRSCGGIDLQLLGVGRNGHIGFNEPGTPFDSRCHVVELSERTRIDNSRFFADGEIVPASAITMGVQDIMEARRVVLIATGEHKAPTLALYHEHGVSERVPFTVLKRHPNATIILDEAAASLLPADAYRSVTSALRA